MTEPGRISRRPPSDGAGLTGPAPANYEVVIGLEVHAQLLTKSKMFCGCTTKFGAPPNAQTCPVCQGMPGVLPVINRRAVEFGIRTALAFDCRVNPSCRFARKHYYYPDMPKNYQISQYEEPLAEDGFLEIEVEGGSRKIGIQRLHLEEDVGKLLHEGTLETAQASLVDFNRSGVPLMETVSRPELHSPEEAATYLKAFRAVLIFLEVCDGNMEEGSLRCDANISLRPRGQTELGTKVEIKNLNSFRNVQRALEFEVRRQAKALDAGERIVQETRLWEADRGYTRSMRSKEFAHDYRYFPDPDLVPLRLDRAWVDEIRAALPELPRARRQRFVTQYGVPAYDAEVLTQSRALADYYEASVQALGSATAGNRADRPKTVSNWIMSELLAALPGDDELAIQRSPITPRHLAGLLRLIEDGTISGKIAKDVFQKMLASGDDAAAIVGREGLTQVADEAALSQIIVTVMAANPRAIDDYKRGKKEAKGALVGQVMKATGGKANPALVNRLLEDKLSKT
jgi:aspartyl-tRNA(Asn)/glutamyl-tRNA(Gln) amidotransferase subunit B